MYKGCGNDDTRTEVFGYEECPTRNSHAAVTFRVDREHGTCDN